jgi:hypothetical protein
MSNSPLSNRTIIALDGHDGSGKTSLASSLAYALSGLYIRPFAGAVGELLIWAVEVGEFAFASELAQKSVKKVLATDNSPILIFDRHWMTVFTLLPEEYWPAWKPLPHTTLCWANLDTTITRLHMRNETPLEPSYHNHYLQSYWHLGERFGCNILRTDQLSFVASVDVLVEWARALLPSIHIKGNAP